MGGERVNIDEVREENLAKRKIMRSAKGKCTQCANKFKAITSAPKEVSDVIPGEKDYKELKVVIDQLATGEFPETIDLTLPNESLERGQTTKTRKLYLNHLDRIKALALSNLYYFDKYVLGYNKMVPHVHGHLAEFVMKVEKRGENEQSTKLILMPRNSFKSCAVTVGYALWRLARDPNLTIIITNEKLDKSKNFLKEIKSHISTNERFKVLFGDWSCNNIKGGKKWSEMRIDIMARTLWSSASTIEVSSVESSEAGKHVDLIICDDLHGQGNTATKDQIEKVVEYWKDLNAVLKPGGEMIIIGTRWDYKDLYQNIQDFAKELGELSNITMMIEKAERDDGTLLFPEVLDKAFLTRQRVLLGSYFYNCTPAETPILMSDWSLKPISEVKVGDKVIGFELGKGNKNARLQIATVLESQSMIEKVNTLHMESGREVRCTANHKWYTGRSGQDLMHRSYKPASVGSSLCAITEIRLPKYNEELDYRSEYILAQLTNLAKFVRYKDRVVSIDEGQKEPVFGLKTTTGNYVAWGYASSNSQYQNEPVEKENALIKKIEKYGDTIGGISAELFFAKCKHFVTADLAFTENKRSDATALLCVAVSDSDGRWYIRQYDTLKTGDPNKIIELIFSYHAKFKPLRWGIEKNNYQGWLKGPLENEMRKRGIFLPIDPPDGIPHYGDGNAGNSKAARLRKIAPRFNYGEAYLHTSMTELQDELMKLTFDGARGHDDLLDALSMMEEIVFWGSTTPSCKDDNEEARLKSIIDFEYEPDEYEMPGKQWLYA